MEHLIPDSFTNFVAASLLAFAVIQAFLALIPKLKTTALRIAAILMLAALSVFSSHWTTYFAAIFIIATAVTELEFLHILAAIIRGDKNYFDFRREFLTKEEALKKSADSLDDGEKKESPIPETPPHQIVVPSESLPVHTNQRLQLAFQIESAALSWTERHLKRRLQRYVRLSSSTGVVELDGYAEGRFGKTDVIIETKWIRKPMHLLPIMSHTLDRMIDMYRQFTEVTKRDSELVLVFVVPSKEGIRDTLVEKIEKKLKEAGVKYQLLFPTYTELDIKVEEKKDAQPGATDNDHG